MISGLWWTLCPTLLLVVYDWGWSLRLRVLFTSHYWSAFYNHTTLGDVGFEGESGSCVEPSCYRGSKWGQYYIVQIVVPIDRGNESSKSIRLVNILLLSGFICYQVVFISNPRILPHR